MFSEQLRAITTATDLMEIGRELNFASKSAQESNRNPDLNLPTSESNVSQLSIANSNTNDSSFSQFEDSGFMGTGNEDNVNRGRWTEAEHVAFVDGLNTYGKDWKVIAEKIPSRTIVQIRTHAQKYFRKLAKITGQPVYSTSKKLVFKGELKRKRPSVSMESTGSSKRLASPSNADRLKELFSESEYSDTESVPERRPTGNARPQGMEIPYAKQEQSASAEYPNHPNTTGTFGNMALSTDLFSQLQLQALNIQLNAINQQNKGVNQISLPPLHQTGTAQQRPLVQNDADFTKIKVRVPRKQEPKVLKRCLSNVTPRTVAAANILASKFGLERNLSWTSVSS